MFKETELWKEMKVIGKVVLTENGIEINDFTFEGINADQGAFLAIDWALFKLHKAQAELLDPRVELLSRSIQIDAPGT
jgi:hypothetical protein